MGELDALPELEVVAEHVEAYHSGSVRVETRQGKGRILVADRGFDPGERVLLEYPLIEAVGDESVPVYKELLKLKEEGALAFGTIFYYAALCSLTAPEVSSSRCQSWLAVPEQTQVQALELHAPEENCKAPSESIRNVIASLWPEGSGPDPLLLERLLQVWIYNSFDLSAGEDGREAGVIFLVAAMMSHSCLPNAAWHLDEANNYILHARRGIEEDEEITIPYLGPSDLCLPTADRRDILSTTKGFRCSCERCSLTRDASRVFRCPRCGKDEVLGLAEDEGAVRSTLSGHVVARDGDLACKECGDLTAAEAEPLLALEARHRHWARYRPGFQPPPNDDDEVERSQDEVSASAKERLQEIRENGLGDRHWIVDVARDTLADEEPRLAVELLQKRLRALGVDASATKRARLQLALGEALISRGSVDDMRQAAAVYGEAAEALALLFGDDHQEHQDAARRQEMALRKASSMSSISAASGSSPGLLGYAEDRHKKVSKRGGPGKKKR
eukprot:TRINITY_DN4972_c0_g3_i1.p1 TRINITY_DN4972_c0_g3~~TRINITY_DN4972_c0_g3_i1.p1  ORF type:complete len:503 (+),score=113.65 TRINITY_DN4972_c0_g3_i1:154-1662(+)